MGLWSHILGALVRSAHKFSHSRQRSRAVLFLPPEAARGPSDLSWVAPLVPTLPSQNAPRVPRGLSPNAKILEKNLPWLNEKWARLHRQREAGAPSAQIQWFFEEVTASQRDKLHELGVSLLSGPPTTGQAADLLGLFEPASAEQKELLRYFKVSLSGMNAARAKLEVATLLADPRKKERWATRKATPMQKEFYRYFNLKPPANLTVAQAKTFMRTYVETVPEAQWAEWEAYERMYTALNAPEARKQGGRKKVSVTRYRSAIAEVKKAGRDLTVMEVEAVLRKLLEHPPTLQRPE